MADEKNIGTPEEESNIDQINNFVTSSEEVKNTEPKIEESNVAESTAKDIPEKVETTKPVEQKKHHEEHHIVHSKKQEVKKIDSKKEETKNVEPEKKEHKNIESKTVEHAHKATKPVHIIKPTIKHVVKSEPKKIVRQTPKIVQTKKILNVKKSVREEKMANHKEHKENHKEHKNKEKFKISKNALMWIGIGVLAVILIVALIFILAPGKSVQPTKNQTTNTIAATVNGEPVYLQDVMTEYNNLNPVVKSVYSVESILNKSIDDLLLYQEAKSRDIQVKAEEVQAEIDAIKIQNKLTDTAFESALAQQGLTLDSVKTIIEKNIMIRKLLNVTVLNNITVTEDQMQSYYDSNKDKFQTPAKVTVQHILILVTENVSNETAKAKIEQIQKELTPTNFCDLVTKYSEDPGSVANCGKYTFAKGDFNNPEFENPSFDLNVGETAIVRTVFGYHLIKKLEAIPAGTRSFENASYEINATLHDQIAQERFDVLIQELRSKASIVDYMSKTDSNGTTVEPVSTVKNLDDFAKCITEKGAAFYGASWCPHCADQKTMFGSSLQYVKYVECAVEGQPQVQTKECTAAGISGYPTWIVNGQSYPGEQTIASLAKLTGCSAP